MRAKIRAIVRNLTAAIAILLFTTTSIALQVPAYKAPRLKGTTHPDLNGLWQALNEANWDIQAHAAQPGRAIRRRCPHRSHPS